jgi:hypothetical protein
MAIPTMIDGVRTRSLLEAKWAAFFTLLGWRWEYEPLDLDGWIPDFLIRTETGKPILVDVKPFFERCGTIERKIAKAIDPDNYHAWITNCAPDGNGNEHTVGWVMSDWLPGGSQWANAVIIAPTKHKNVYGFAEGWEGCFADKITGIYEGDHYYHPLSFDEVRAIWKRACNEVQWQPRREAGS